MRVLLISANTERINLPTFPLGLAWVAQGTMDLGNWFLMSARKPGGAA